MSLSPGTGLDRYQITALRALIVILLCPGTLAAQDTPPSSPTGSNGTRAGEILRFLGGAGLGLAGHEAGHLLFDFAFNADPSITKVQFGGIPFFAITHRNALSRRPEYTVSSAGFWLQHAASEWILTRRPNIRAEHAPVAKGVLAFHVLLSVGYGAVALARAGPIERDTYGMADSLQVDERWVGTMILASAALDAYRYFRPDSRWATWASRTAKLALLLLVIR